MGTFECNILPFQSLSIISLAIRGFTDSKALFEATQNNYMDISPDVLADALKLMGERGEAISTAK